MSEKDVCDCGREGCNGNHFMSRAEEEGLNAEADAYQADADAHSGHCPRCAALEKHLADTQADLNDARAEYRSQEKDCASFRAALPASNKLRDIALELREPGLFAKAIVDLMQTDLMLFASRIDAVGGDRKPDRPPIVCLCGSTRFWREFQRQGLNETMAGRIVLSIGAASGTDDEHFGNLPREEYERVKTMLDELHLRKIDLADEVLILNVGGYIGESTRRELEYARAHGKVVRFLEPEKAREG